MSHPFLSKLPNAALIGVCLMALAACKEDPKGHQPPEPKTLELPVTKATVARVDRLYSTPGSVVSDERVEVSSRTTGYIQRISVNEGDVVSKGDILVEIDPTDIDGAISRAQAALNSAQTGLGDAEQDVVRLAGLLEKGVVSNEAVRKANVGRDVAQARLAEAQAALDTALAGRRYTTITSPIDGIAVARQKQVGDLATPGVPIVTIESRTNLLFKTSVSESRIASVQVGDSVSVGIDALDDTETGDVLRIIPSGDPVTRRYDVEISLAAGLEVFPGMFGRAQFIIGTDEIVVVATDALLERGGLRGVFVVDDDDTARFRWLRTGRDFADTTEVQVGLDGGETILARDDVQLRDGDKIVTAEKVPADE